ncbi:MAG: ABC transporter substrate-binding protein [Rhizobiaceae bacterium]|nr:ABC transporter substrate-binding protein [Rhizobiaceae bacterium]
MKTTRRMLVAGAASTAILLGMPWAHAQETINITALVEQTGAIAAAGQDIGRGIEMGIDTVNASGRLGNYKIVADVKDTASTPATGAALASQVASSDSIAILGPALSSVAMAVAPIAQRSGVPMIAIQANTAGLVETGDHVYRLTPPFYTFNGLTYKYLAQQGLKKVALSYISNIPSVTGLGRDFAPKWIEANGLELVAEETMPVNTTDFSTTIAKLVASNPDAIGLYNLDTQLPALISGIRRAGFTGQLFCYAISPATLSAVGDAGDGIVLSIDYSPALDDPSSVEFTKAFGEKYGGTPTIYHANGYDSVLFLGAALEKVIAGGAKPDRENLLAAMAEVAQTGIDGASGHLRFDSQTHRDARVAGVLVQYKGGVPSVLLKGDPNVEEQ